MTRRTTSSLAFAGLLSLMLVPGCDEEQPPASDSGVEASVDQAYVDVDQPDTAQPDLPPPTCTDKKLNGAETDVDCGGGTCPKCANAKK